MSLGAKIVFESQNRIGGQYKSAKDMLNDSVRDKNNNYPEYRNRSPPDGEMSDEIARVSHNLAKDLNFLSNSLLTKSENFIPGDSLNSSVISRNISKTYDTNSAEKSTSLDQSINSGNTITHHLNGPFTPPISLALSFSNDPSTDMSTVSTENKFIASSTSQSPSRRTWTVGSEPLDNLMLSNMCSLSERLCTIANKVSKKVKILHIPLHHDPPIKNGLSEASHVPVLQQTSTEEMALLANNLRYLESQLINIDYLVDPNRNLEALN